MDLKEIKNSFTNRHPWETTRLIFFKKRLLSYFFAADSKILDVGAGDAFFSTEIFKTRTPRGELHCWDAFYQEDKRDGNIFQVKHQPTGSFSLILLMDVLEHVENDEAFLKKVVYQNSNQHSYFLISVPAWTFLYTSHDKKLQHFRRYSLKRLKELLQNSDLELLEGGGLFYFLLFPRCLIKFREILFGSAREISGIGTWKGGTCFTWFVLALMKLDTYLTLLLMSLHLFIPGLSLWVIARKKRI